MTMDFRELVLTSTLLQNINNMLKFDVKVRYDS